MEEVKKIQECEKEKYLKHNIEYQPNFDQKL